MVFILSKKKTPLTPTHKVSIIDILKLYKKEMAMLMQWQQSNSNKHQKFPLTQIVDYEWIEDE
jgi:hypothetical protein